MGRYDAVYLRSIADPEGSWAEVGAAPRPCVPVAAFKTATVVKRLPKTCSGKILRSTMRAIADGEDYRTPATIDDPAILDEITRSHQGIGYPKGA